MPKNNLRKLRKKAGLTQRQLAEKAGTSQQQIQRLEAGVQEITLALAFHLCDALGETMDAVFPSAAKPISAVLKKIKKGDKDTHPITRIRTDEKATAELAAVGIDTDSRGERAQIQPEQRRYRNPAYQRHRKKSAMAQRSSREL
jgi:transcriptional regulator with XRE-family HTH domain